MNKETFLNQLREKISYLPQNEVDERILFYEEMIDDRIEEGMTEEDAVAAVGSVDSISKHVMSETPLSKLVIDKVKPDRSLRGWEIALLIIGAPLWIPLVIAAFSILLSVYIVLWSIVIVIYAADLSFAVGAVCAVPTFFYYFISGNGAGGLFMIGACLILIGLTILTFYACVYITQGMIYISKAIALWIKSLFVRKENQSNE